MNCPSRTDDTLENPGWNQNPSPLNADLTTRNDFNGMANARQQRGSSSSNSLGITEEEASRTRWQQQGDEAGYEEEKIGPKSEVVQTVGAVSGVTGEDEFPGREHQTSSIAIGSPLTKIFKSLLAFVRGDNNDNEKKKWWTYIFKFARFVGPGFIIAVAYIDPGNYATDVSSGAEYRYRLLFVVLLSNLFAIFLQSLCIKLGSVTGLNLAENCRQHLPKWVVIVLYIFAEAAIIATDISEV